MNYLEDYDELSEMMEQLNLSPHPEGGFFRELSRSEEVVGEEGLPGAILEALPVHQYYYFCLMAIFRLFTGFGRMRSGVFTPEVRCASTF